MSAKTRYTDEPLGKVRVVADFLPSPAELAFREERHTQYQRMIRRLLDANVEGQAQARPSRRTVSEKAAQRR